MKDVAEVAERKLPNGVRWRALALNLGRAEARPYIFGADSRRGFSWGFLVGGESGI